MTVLRHPLVEATHRRAREATPRIVVRPLARTLPLLLLAFIISNAWGMKAVRVTSRSVTDLFGMGMDTISYVHTIANDRAVLEVMDHGSRNRNIIRLDRELVWFVEAAHASYREYFYATERRMHFYEMQTAAAVPSDSGVTIDTLGIDGVIAGLAVRHFRARSATRMGLGAITATEDWWAAADGPGFDIMRSFQAGLDSVGYAPYTNSVWIPGATDLSGTAALRRPFMYVMQQRVAINVPPSMPPPAAVARSALLDSILRVNGRNSQSTTWNAGGDDVEKIELVDVPDTFFELPHGLKRDEVSSTPTDPERIHESVRIDSLSHARAAGTKSPKH